MKPNEELILGLKRALGVLYGSEGDIDFAIFMIEKDIETLEAEEEVPVEAK